jgi:hypothetical protein
MGSFASVTITVEFNDEAKASEFSAIVKDLDNQLVKRGEIEPFDTEIDGVDFDVDNLRVEIRLSSNRSQNAEWQAETISDIAKNEFKEFILGFDATMNMPSTIIFWTVDEEAWDEE